MLELNEEQRLAIQRAGENPVRVSDPDTKAEYVVLKADFYERMRRVFEEVDPSFYEFEEIERA